MKRLYLFAALFVALIAPSWWPVPASAERGAPQLVTFPGIEGVWLFTQGGAVPVATNLATGQSVAITSSSFLSPGLYTFTNGETLLVLAPGSHAQAVPPTIQPIQINLFNPASRPAPGTPGAPAVPLVSGNGQPIHVNLWNPGEPLPGSGQADHAAGPAGATGNAASPEPEPEPGSHEPGTSPHQ